MRIKMSLSLLNGDGGEKRWLWKQVLGQQKPTSIATGPFFFYIRRFGSNAYVAIVDDNTLSYDTVKVSKETPYRFRHVVRRWIASPDVCASVIRVRLKYRLSKQEKPIAIRMYVKNKSIAILSFCYASVVGCLRRVIFWRPENTWRECRAASPEG